MTYEEKKAWLWRYRSAKRFERLRLDELATLEAEAMHTTQRYSAMPGGGGDGQALPRAVERIEEARQAAEAPPVRPAGGLGQDRRLRPVVPQPDVPASQRRRPPAGHQKSGANRSGPDLITLSTSAKI